MKRADTRYAVASPCREDSRVLGFVNKYLKMPGKFTELVVEIAAPPSGELNHRGGRVLFGVEPGGRIIGQMVSDHTVEEVAQELQQIDPPVFPTIDRVDVAADRLIPVNPAPIPLQVHPHSTPKTPAPTNMPTKCREDATLNWFGEPE